MRRRRGMKTVPGNNLGTARRSVQAWQLAGNARPCVGFIEAQCAGAGACGQCPTSFSLHRGAVRRRKSSRAMPGPAMASVRRSAQARHLVCLARPHSGFTVAHCAGTATPG